MGYHIISLLLTFFIRYIPDLIKDKKLYISCPPLFKVAEKTRKQEINYFWSYEDVQKFVLKKGLKESDYMLQRFKGLGEMNADIIAETSLDPKTRKMKLVQLGDMSRADDVIKKLMGKNAKTKREFLQTGII